MCFYEQKKDFIYNHSFGIYCTFLACLAYFVVDYISYRSVTDVGKDTASVVSTVSKKQVDIPVNFKKLKKVNPDIYAWINIPDTVVDYPILQSSDEDGKSFYLTRDVNRKNSKYGAIYTQDYNATDFNDFNTLIYGHNMFNGTMFGSLKKYRNEKFFKSHQDIVIYMPNRILKYRVFAAYVFDDRHIMLSFDFNDKLAREEYLETVFACKKQLTSNFDDTISVGPDDKIITLSTCTSNDRQRYLVQGVLVYDSDTDS